MLDLERSHPATFSEPVLDVLRSEMSKVVRPGDVLLDPFAGVGTVHRLAEDLGVRSYGVEIELEWGYRSLWTFIGDATRLPHATATIDHAVTSPCYGNRLADNYLPPESDTSRRYTYTTALGRKPSEGSAAGMQWGYEYCDLHERAWRELYRVVRPGGWLFLNVKNHHRAVSSMTGWQFEMAEWYGGVDLPPYRRLSDVRQALYNIGITRIEQPVVEWHLDTLESIGFEWQESIRVRDATGIGGSGPVTSESCERVLIFRRNEVPCAQS